MDIREQAFEAIRQRAARSLKTLPELSDEASVSRTTLWRALKPGRQARPDAWIATARKLEAKLTEIEAQKEKV